MQQYRTIKGFATAELSEKRSRFIASIAFVQTEDEAVGFINKIKKQHTMANHNVYAYVLRDGDRARFSDDGEPAKTAGLPVLETIRHAQLTDCAVVVTRYFGGTLLGTGGLVRAYTQAAKDAVSAAEIVTVSLCVSIETEIDYSLFEQAQRIIQKAGAKDINADFTHNVTIKFTMLSGSEALVIQELTQLSRGSLRHVISAPFYSPF